MDLIIFESLLSLSKKSPILSSALSDILNISNDTASVITPKQVPHSLSPAKTKNPIITNNPIVDPINPK